MTENQFYHAEEVLETESFWCREGYIPLYLFEKKQLGNGTKQIECLGYTFECRDNPINVLRNLDRTDIQKEETCQTISNYKSTNDTNLTKLVTLLKLSNKDSHRLKILNELTDPLCKEKIDDYTCKYFKKNGEFKDELVIKQERNSVFIQKSYLMKYLADKNLLFLQYFFFNSEIPILAEKSFNIKPTTDKGIERTDDKSYIDCKIVFGNSEIQSCNRHVKRILF